MSRARAALSGLHVIADDDPRWPWSPTEQARAACAGGASVVQLRMKHGTDREAIELGGVLRTLTREAEVLLFVNDRFDLALACEADGVHLGQGDLPPARLPAAARQRLLVGRSTHDLDQARAAALEDVDYLALGPVFGTTSKESAYPAAGIDMLREAVDIASPLPLIAIGGVAAGHVPELRAAGAAGAAVISAVAAAAEPRGAVRELAAAFAAGAR